MKIRKLNADEIECRVSQVSAKGCNLLLYKTARVDRAILDEVFTPLKWQNDFKEIDGKMYGGIGVENDNGQWIWKWDCGTESNTEAEKGQASDCFKRAGFKWGIGVELYTAPRIFVNCSTSKNEKGKYIVDDYKTFEVQTIGYSDKGDINQLVIVDNNGKTAFKLGQTNPKSETKPITKPTTTNPDADLDIYEGLKACNTTKLAFAYFQEQMNNVSNKSKFRSEYQKVYNDLKKKEG